MNARPPFEARCLLFVPGSRPERFDKALAAGADFICIDLEDAVGLDDKDRARDSALAFVAANPGARERLIIRINPVASDAGAKDLAAVAATAAPPASVMLPKVEAAGDIATADAALGHHDLALIALIESPRGVLAAEAIADASPRLVALMFGGYDYAIALRGAPSWDTFLMPRARLAQVAASFELGFIDVPYVELADAAGFEAETLRVIALGATARAAIHPSQVSIIVRCFAPTADAVASATRVIAAIEAAKGEAVKVDGKLVDRPIELAARRVLADAARAPKT